MLERFTKLLSTQDKTTITTSTVSPTQSKGLQRFVTAIVAGAIIFNSIASFGAVIAGDYLAKQEAASYSQIHKETKATIENVINNYNLNTESTVKNDYPNIESAIEGTEKKTTTININAVNASPFQHKIHQLMSGMKFESGYLYGSQSLYQKGYHSTTIDMHELKNYFNGDAPDFIILHELGHSLISHNSDLGTYNNMRRSAIHALDVQQAESLLSVYSESHADVYAILKIAQVKGTDIALNIAQKVYDHRERWGEFGHLSKSTASHDTSHALNKVTDFLIEHPNLDKLSQNDIYKISVDLGVQSMNQWAIKHNITIPDTTKVELESIANKSLNAITTQDVKVSFMRATSAESYMNLFTNGLIEKLLNNSTEMTYAHDWRSEGEKNLMSTPQIPTMYQLPTLPTI